MTAENRSKILQQLEQEIIPESLGGLSDKSEYIQQVLQWAETNYKDSTSQIDRKKEIQSQTKEYLTEILDMVAGEIETNATNLCNYLHVQDDALNELTVEIDLLFNRLQLKKEKEGQILYDEVMNFKFKPNSNENEEFENEEDKKIRRNKEEDNDDDDVLDDTLHGLLESKHLIRIDDETNLQYKNAQECYTDDMGLAPTVETEINPAYRNANNQYNALRFVENFEDDLQ